MNLLKQLNAAMAYIEENLCGEIDFEKAAGIACVTADSLARFFSYMTGMTLTEYVRRRRLTRAAPDLRCGMRVVDAAVKYGYDSATAFSRAFARQHGITPSEYRKNGGSLRLYPPASFHISIRGAREMNFRLIELPEIGICGVSEPYEGQGYANREEIRHVMWDEREKDIPGQICPGRWNEPGSSRDGVWYGVWQDGRYMIARETEDAGNRAPERRILPAGLYAAFATDRGSLAWEEFPKLFDLIFGSWLPDSGFRRRGDLIVEVYHLLTDHDLRRKHRRYEVWLPVEETEPRDDTQKGF